MKTKEKKLTSRMMILLAAALMTLSIPAGRAGVLDDFEVTYYHTDHLGNVLAMTDEAGEKVWPVDSDPGTDSHGIKVYEPFGPTDESTGSWDSGPIFVFTGKEIDRIEVGENHLNINDFGARHHLPETAAFMSPDPVEGDFSNPLSWNRYAFCLNNPVNFVDPDGEKTLRHPIQKSNDPHGAEGCAGGGGATGYIKPGAVWKGFKAGVRAKFSSKGSSVKGSSSKSGPKPNNGNAKPHGGEKHNGAIDQKVEQVKKDPSVTNIRKNQQQVDVNGKNAGRNRPDVQYDKKGRHHNVEFDNSKKASEKHGTTIKQNDPNAKVELNNL